MNYLVRDIAQNIQNKLQANKVVIIFGARRVGKTMLVKEILNTLNEPVLILNGEDINVHDKLSIRSAENYKQLLGCLLYTSPSPRDRQKSRMPSSA